MPNQQRQPRLHFLFAAAFLLMQMFAVVHAYEHLSDVEHTEHESCDICLAANALDSNHVNADIFVTTFPVDSIFIPSPKITSDTAVFKIQLIRAPPEIHNT